MAPEYEVGFKFVRNLGVDKEVKRIHTAASLVVDKTKKVDIADTKKISLTIDADSIEDAQNAASAIYRSDALPTNEGYALTGLSVRENVEVMGLVGPKVEYPPQLSVSSSRVRMLDMFSQVLRPGKKVYYPGPNIDASPSMVPGFDESEIIYLDTQENNVQALKQAGLKAYQGRAEQFDPGEIDVLLCLGFFRKETLSFVKQNGYVVMEGLFPSEGEIEGFELIAKIGLDAEDKPYLDKNNLSNPSKGDLPTRMFILKKS